MPEETTTCEGVNETQMSKTRRAASDFFACAIDEYARCATDATEIGQLCGREAARSSCVALSSGEARVLGRLMALGGVVPAARPPLVPAACGTRCAQPAKMGA
jgi:hypothetical protein